jgi:predicted DNA binding CopG/RHH family protein
MKNAKKVPSKITPEQAVEFLESFRKLGSEIDEPTQLISLRVPGNILKSLKIRARVEGKKYQSLMLEYVRNGLKTDI